MKYLKTIALTLFLTTGFFLPSCDKSDIPRCDDVGPLLLFFDVITMTVSNFSDYDKLIEIPANDTIAFEELDRTYIDYHVIYLASKQQKRNWSFSLMPTANACTYTQGSSGSKTEALVNFNITTINDFDNDHLANSSINDLFDYHGGFSNYLDDSIPLSQFLAEQTGNLQTEDMSLELIKAPEIDQKFQIKVEMELSTGETFEFETEPIFITP